MYFTVPYNITVYIVSEPFVQLCSLLELSISVAISSVVKNQNLVTLACLLCYTSIRFLLLRHCLSGIGINPMRVLGSRSSQNFSGEGP